MTGAVMKLLSALALCLLVSGCAYVKVIFQKLPDPAYTSPEAKEAVLQRLDAEGVTRWREANRRIEKAIRRDHPAPWFQMTRESFQAQVADLDRDLPGLSEYQVVLRWKRILAALGDGHTQLWERATWLRLWPIEAALAGDALVITAVANGQTAWLGARIRTVGGEPVEAYLRRLDAFVVEPVPSKRRETLARYFAPSWTWLEALGALSPAARPVLELETRQGERLQATLEVKPAESLRWTPLPKGQPLLRDLEPRRNYAFRFLQEHQTLYVRYRRCRDDEAESMVAFMDRILKEAAGRPLKRLVVDLRGNGGGDERVSEPLLSWASTYPAFRQREGVLVLTDAGTYSSGHGLARRLKRVGALTVGAETGQPENAFGQVHFTPLPGLKPVFGCSLRRFLWDKADSEAWRRGLVPDLPLEPTMDDVLGLKDSVLDRVLAWPFSSGGSR